MKGINGRHQRQTEKGKNNARGQGWRLHEGKVEEPSFPQRAAMSRSFLRAGPL